MKSKAIINDRIFQKFKKSSIFIVRTKHSVPKLRICKEQPKKYNNFQISSESIDQILYAIQSRINEGKQMPLLIWEKIKDHLTCLKSKFIAETETNKQNNIQSNHGLSRSSSSNFFTKSSADPLGNIINLKETPQISQHQNFRLKLTKNKRKELSSEQKQIQTIEQKMKFLNEKLEIYEKDYPKLTEQLQQSQLKFQQVKIQMQALIKQYNEQISQKQQCEYRLRQSLTEVQQKFESTKRKLSITQTQLNQREIEIINLWHILRK